MSALSVRFIAARGDVTSRHFWLRASRDLTLLPRRSPRPLEILSLAFAVVAAAAVIAAAGRMEAVVNLLSHKWIHLTDGAILAFAVSIIAVPEARERCYASCSLRSRSRCSTTLSKPSWWFGLA
jgi:hypothetical protein